MMLAKSTDIKLNKTWDSKQSVTGNTECGIILYLFKYQIMGKAFKYGAQVLHGNCKIK